MGKNLKYLEEFTKIYSNSPITNNAGGMGFNHSYALYCILKSEEPSLIVESGVWKGHSTYIIESALPESQIVSLDPNLNKREYISGNADYFETDFNLVDWSKYPYLNNSVCFFDDHQNSLERLKEMKWWGFKKGIFEDNFPEGEGDSYSLKQILSNSGHINIELSEKYLPVRKKEKLKRRIEENILNKYYFRQSMLTKPNSVDSKGFNLNLRYLQEFPPVFTHKFNLWDKPWDGKYKKEDDLISSENINNYPQFKKFFTNNEGHFDYGYITFVELLN